MRERPCLMCSHCGRIVPPAGYERLRGSVCGEQWGDRICSGQLRPKAPDDAIRNGQVWRGPPCRNGRQVEMFVLVVDAHYGENVSVCTCDRKGCPIPVQVNTRRGPRSIVRHRVIKRERFTPGAHNGFEFHHEGPQA